MRTIPAKIINGITCNWEKGFLIRIYGKTETFWWSTRNISIMMSESEIPAEYDRIAYQVDGNNSSSISRIRSGTDIALGGGNNYISDFSFTLLNQDIYSNTLNLNNLDGCMAAIYMFYISPNDAVIQLNDAMVIAIGVIDEIKVFSQNEIRIVCTSSEYFRHRVIPDKRINENDFPYAPEQSLGEVIPILYGSFMGTDLSICDYNLAPAICIDQNSKEFAFAKHECKSISVDAYYPVKKYDLFSRIISSNSFSNTSEKASDELTENLRCELSLQPKYKGTQMDSDYSALYKSAVDKDANTSILFQSGDNFYLKLQEPGSIGNPEIFDVDNNQGYLRLYLNLGSVTNGSSGKAAKIKYYLDNNFVYINNFDILASMENSEVSFLFYFPVTVFYDILSNIEIGFTVENGGSVEIKNVYVKFKYQV
jgi:hypothetical protein